jgi:hypothetical protein
MCMRATAMAEAFCNQVLRATIDTQVESGPNRVLTIDPSTGLARLRTKQWPVLAVISGQYAANVQFPRSGAYQTIPLNMMEVEEEVPMVTGSYAAGGSADGGTSILIAPGYITWVYGRNGFRLTAQYLTGWPHCGIMSPVTAGDMTLSVDDVTGFGAATVSTPIVLPLFDGIYTEYMTVTGISNTVNNTSGLSAYGAGNLMLGVAAVNNHAGPTNQIAACLLSAMPMAIQQAVILLACHEAMVRGATATTVPRQPGAQITGGGGSSLDLEAFELLLPFKRII